MKRKLFLTGIITFSALVLLSACKSTNNEDSEFSEEEEFDPNTSLNTVFDGKIFSIPSPVQTGYLVKQLKLEYDPSILNDDGNAQQYVTEYQQSLNLGIYGTDLGYTALYSQKSKTIEYLSSIENLTSQLGLDAAFHPNFLERFEKNTANEDSMIYLMTNAFKEADNFLKSANRKYTSALILTGGWIESLYLACRLYEKKPSPDIRNRIGEQKESLNSIIDLVSTYNKGGSNDKLIADLKELKIYFDKIEMNYEYAAPSTDAKNKITTLNHKLTVEIKEDNLVKITRKILEIRSNIIKAS